MGCKTPVPFDLQKYVETARSECTAKQENKATYNAGYIFS